MRWRRNRCRPHPDAVSRTPPAPAPDAEPAAWLRSRLSWAATPGAHWVTATVGTGWPAYARVLHRPADGGRAVGNLEAHALSALCGVLATRTTTADRCWFAVWEGWGWPRPGSSTRVVASSDSGQVPEPVREAPDEWRLRLEAPTFVLPFRTYLLYGGPLEAALRIGDWVTADWFIAQSPSIFWPDDHAWCVATEIDFDSTLVGGSAELIDAVVASPDLAAAQIEPDAPYPGRIAT